MPKGFEFLILALIQEPLKLTVLCTIIVPSISLQIHSTVVLSTVVLFQRSDFIYQFFFPATQSSHAFDPSAPPKPLLPRSPPCCSKGQFSGLTLTSRQHSTVDHFLLLQVFSSPNFRDTIHLLVFLLPNWFVPTQLLCKFFSSETS